MTQEQFFRAAFIFWCLYVGYRGFRSFGSGVLRISNFKASPKLISRNERPAAYWTCVAFFYAILLALIAFAAFARPTR